ncbi:hypothetical protein BD408DRAFT_483669 [Parasitella parasitica]|nr:hypothetical protein BD408DRAFT_483669 [Parasitella parasitica]
MNFTLYKRRKQRQKPNILTIEQSQELGHLAGNKLMKNVTDQGLIPINLFRLRKRKLEAIYSYLFDHHLTHRREPIIEALQTHQLAEYLLNTIYPGYPACKAKNLAYTEYRECREKELGQISPLAYDYVPTTEVYDRLDEIYRVDVSWQEEHKITSSIDMSVPAIKKSLERIRVAHNDKATDGIEYHLYFWNSTRTLIKPQCKSLRLNFEEIWTTKKERVVSEGFMHVDVTEELKKCFARPSRKAKKLNTHSQENCATSISALPSNSSGKKTKASDKISVPMTTKTPPSVTDHNVMNSGEQKSKLKPGPPERVIKLEVELHDNEEYNISHISISAVFKKSTSELVCELYLQATTECISRSIRKSTFPLDTQQMIIHLLKQYHRAEGAEAKLVNAETIFMTCQSNTLLSASTENSSEEEYDESELNEAVSLIDFNTGRRIQHPIKSLHCRHRSCFDAASFFNQHADIKLWHCPICDVHIKSFEELRIDYTIKEALNQHPNQDKLYVFRDVLISENELFGEASLIMDDLIEIDDEDDEDDTNEADRCRRRKRSSNNQEGSSKNYPVQKRFRTLTHVM